MAKPLLSCVVEFCPDEPERLHRGRLKGLYLLLPLCPDHAEVYETTPASETLTRQWTLPHDGSSAPTVLGGHP